MPLVRLHDMMRFPSLIRTTDNNRFICHIAERVGLRWRSRHYWWLFSTNLLGGQPQPRSTWAYLCNWHFTYFHYHFAFHNLCNNIPTLSCQTNCEQQNHITVCHHNDWWIDIMDFMPIILRLLLTTSSADSLFAVIYELWIVNTVLQ